MKRVALLVLGGALFCAGYVVAQQKPAPEIRRVVTKLDPSGKAVVMIDERTKLVAPRPPNLVANIWVADKAQPDFSWTDDRGKTKVGVAPKALQQVQLSEAIIELVKAGLGISTMARWAIEPYVRAGAIRTAKLTRKGFKRRWGAVMLRDMASTPYAKDFIDLIIRRSPVTVAPPQVEAPRRERA